MSATTVPEGYEIVPYDPEHEGEVASLESILWRGDHDDNVAHLRWKYRDGPLREHNHLFVALAAGRVVGARGLVGAVWEARRGADAAPIRFTALSAADLVIAPAHRGSGLDRRLTGEALALASRGPYPLAFSLSASAVNRLALQMAGWRRAFPLAIWVRPARPGLAERLMRRVREPDPTRRFAGRREVTRRTPSGMVVSVRRQPRPRDMAALVGRAAWDGRFRQVRGEDFFAWRYAGPIAVNRFVYADQGALRGYLVLQARRHRPGTIMLVDFEAENPDVLADLLAAAVAWAEGFRLDFWDEGMLADMAPRLASLGFHRAGGGRGVRAEGPALLVRTLDAAGATALEEASGRTITAHEDWDLRPAYSDAY